MKGYAPGKTHTLLLFQDGLFANFALYDFTDVPEMGHLPFGFPLLLLGVVFHIYRVCAAIGALHLHIPAALVAHDSRSAADGAVAQFDEIIQIHVISP